MKQSHVLVSAIALWLPSSSADLLRCCRPAPNRPAICDEYDGGPACNPYPECNLCTTHQEECSLMSVSTPTFSCDNTKACCSVADPSFKPVASSRTWAEQCDFVAAATGNSFVNCQTPDILPTEGTGVNTGAPVNAGMMDDPHIQTWNNTWFDWHGECDTVLVHVPDFDNGDDLTIHVRTTIRYAYSFIEIAILTLGSLVFEVAGWGQYVLNGVANADLDGFPITVAKSDTKQHRFQVKIGSHNNETIVFGTFKDMVSVKIHGATKEHWARSVGIMGSFDGKLLARDGVTVMEDTDAFGQEWQVQPYEASLFQLTREPQAPHKCILPADKMAKKNSRRLGEQSISKEEAASACAYLGESARKEACMSDVIAVGDLDIAKASDY